MVNLGEKDNIGVKIGRPKEITKKKKKGSQKETNKQIQWLETGKIRKRMEAIEPNEVNEVVVVEENMVMEGSQLRRITWTEKRLRQERDLVKKENKRLQKQVKMLTQ